MSSERFHKAAKDGLLDVLKQATKKEANSKDVDSMTPVLWAAFEGRLDALRLLVGRGGDPDKCDQFGNSALHLAAAKGHLQCVDFLVKFGVNLYALDIDKHTAKDLAAINNNDDILRYLDQATSNFESTEKKKARTMKEQAEKYCEKRMKEYAKKQQKMEEDYELLKPQKAQKTNMLTAIRQKFLSSSHGNLHKLSDNPQTQQQIIKQQQAKFSELVSGSISSRSGAGAVRKKALASKQKQAALLQQQQHNIDDNGFKIGEIEANGKRTITSLTGLQRDSEVLYVGTFSSNEETGKRGKISDVFDLETNSEIDQLTSEAQRLGYGTLSRSFSQPDFLVAQQFEDEISNEIKMHRPTGIFDRPMLGSIAFPRSVTATLNHLGQPEGSLDSSNNSASNSRTNSKSGKSLTNRKSRSFLNMSDSDSERASESDDDEDSAASPIERFLAVWGLEEHLHIFQKQQIDLNTLMLLTESDLKSLGLPLGPFRKLFIAIQDRKNALENPGVITDSRL